MTAVIVLILALIVVAVTLVAYTVWYFRWEARETGGVAYFGKPIAARRALKQRIRLYSRPANFIVRLLARANRGKGSMPSFEYEGVHGPSRVSSADVFARACAYEPRREDVFVATQMRCGTTWMQQLVFEIVSRGQGDLSDSGHRHLYAVSPWIDAVNSVSMEDAPLVGNPPTRIIKTHLPAKLCPQSDAAKYIYVARHPVSCFASIVDYNRSLLGPLAPSAHALADWFCSDRMYWLPWPAHVAGWWERAQSHANVLFIHFEEMKRDLGSVVDRVAAFLGCTLTADERQKVIEKSGFEYMKVHEELFEMAPPTMFSVAGGRFLASGAATRHEDVTAEIRTRILDYCREALRSTTYPAERFYPALAAKAAPQHAPAAAKDL